MSSQPRWEIVEEVGSTSSELMARASADPDAWPDLSVLLATRQLAGRGRAGRTWTTDSHPALTFSVLLRPSLPAERWGWVPLLAGVAVVQALHELQPDGAAPPHEVACGLKWPNDVVHYGGPEVLAEWGCLRKVAGVLSEVTPDRSGVVVGIGANLVTGGLPVPWAGAAEELGVRASAPDLARTIHHHLAALIESWQAGADPAAVVAPVCLTLGTHVRVTLPGGGIHDGEATGLAADGALRVRTPEGERVVHAGDVEHVRPA
ncbi:biotin--[acetyl-CoA-carboxylase] ligase [Ruania suaedae]|uniref:biotin--[acetyl-CoA-carboxylase] ligase n=1 Tax=Ruania suaedae TaxID=2897774 RepID=UPI001E58A95A|nr:biotin--[acetyl-CoA-carboxylase] ligase [Ruania suaedae]UFU02271.1 biotin--[acetyl-CoA-carboxylase] ligase [Ruania suaedae]